MLRNCSKTALKYIEFCSDIAPNMLQDCPETALKLLHICSKIAPQLLRNRTRTALKSIVIFLWFCFDLASILLRFCSEIAPKLPRNSSWFLGLLSYFRFGLKNSILNLRDFPLFLSCLMIAFGILSGFQSDAFRVGISSLYWNSSTRGILWNTFIHNKSAPPLFTSLQILQRFFLKTKYIKNWPKIGQKLTKNWLKIHQKSIKNWPKIHQKSIINWPKIDQKLTKNP